MKKSQRNVEELQARVLNHKRRQGVTESREAKKDDEYKKGDVEDVKVEQSTEAPLRVLDAKMDVGDTPEGSRTKRKKWRITDPAQIAPNVYHRDLFVANFPLIKVVDVPRGCEFPVPDKFGGNVLDSKETFQARKRWIKRFLDVEHMYSKAETENQAFPMHFACLESLSQFTKLSKEEVEMHNDICSNSKRKWSYEKIKGTRKKRKMDDDYEENVGLRIVPDMEDVQGPLGANGSDGDNEGMSTAGVLTGDLQQDVDVATGFADGVLHVMDQRPLKRAAPNSKDIMNPDRVACVLERVSEGQT